MICRTLEDLQAAVAKLGAAQLDRWELLDLCGVQGATPGPGLKFLGTLFDKQTNDALGIVVDKTLTAVGLQTKLGSRIFVRVSAIK